MANAKRNWLETRFGPVPLDPEFRRRELLASNPMAWMISVNGFIVDARTRPPKVQAEARRRGLIPDLPAGGKREGVQG